MNGLNHTYSVQHAKLHRVDFTTNITHKEPHNPQGTNMSKLNHTTHITHKESIWTH